MYARIYSLVKYTLIYSVLISIMACNPKQPVNNENSVINLDSLSWAEKMAKSQMIRNGDSLAYDSATKSYWNYDKGTYLKGIEMVFNLTHKQEYVDYIKKTLDSFLSEDGSIKSYHIDEYNLDQINLGKMLLFLFEKTNDVKYKTAAQLIRKQLDGHPRTKEGGFWHKKKYPYQMWLDGLYMQAPFYAQYAKMFNQEKDFDDIANQFIWMSNHTYDAKTGLFYHAWDESKQQKWANKNTGCSPNFWSRAMGWYAMALVDALDYFPEQHPKRQQLITILNNLAGGLVKYQDSTSGTWFQMTEFKEVKKNYLEASASCMFVYALAKAQRKGYISNSYLSNINSGFKGLISTFVTKDTSGIYSLNYCCKSAGLGGDPYRDGTIEYYNSEPIISNDLKGIGPFIMAAVEMELAKK